MNNKSVKDNRRDIKIRVERTKPVRNFALSDSYIQDVIDCSTKNQI